MLHFGSRCWWHVVHEAYRIWGSPQLHFENVCKKDMKSIGLDILRWKAIANGHLCWKQILHKSMKWGKRTWKLSINKSVLEERESDQSWWRASSNAVTACKAAVPVEPQLMLHCYQKLVQNYPGTDNRWFLETNKCLYLSISRSQIDVAQGVRNG